MDGLTADVCSRYTLNPIMMATQ